MNIRSGDGKNIIIELSCDDLEGLDITFEEMDYANIETRRVIWTLLDMARIELGRDIDPSGRMLIEAAAGEGGGCILSFTVLSPESETAPRSLLLKKQSEAAVTVWEFSRLDSAARACRALNESGEIKNSRAFSLGGRYRLLITGLGIKGGIMSEFGERVDLPFAAKRTEEGWKIIAEENAVALLARLA